jgi:hypothetical protein
MVSLAGRLGATNPRVDRFSLAEDEENVGAGSRGLWLKRGFRQKPLRALQELSSVQFLAYPT